MCNSDNEIANIDLNDDALEFNADVAVRQRCDAAWHWVYDQGNAVQGPLFLIWLVTGGQATLQADDTRYVVRRGDFLLMPSTGIRYEGRHDPHEPLEVSWLFLRIVHKEGRGVLANSIEGIPFYTPLADVAFAERLMDEVIAAEGVLRGVWLRSLLDAVRAQQERRQMPEAGRRVLALARQIQEDPGRFRGLEDMRAVLPYSKDHLIRLFRLYHHVTPGDFLIQARMDTARALLAISGFSIKQIAAQLGYPDSFCFSRQFNLRNGATPSEYRSRQTRGNGVVVSPDQAVTNGEGGR